MRKIAARTMGALNASRFPAYPGRESTAATAQKAATAAASRAQTGTAVLKRSSEPRLSGMRAAHDGLTAQTQARSAQKTTLRMAKMLSTTRRKVMAVKRYDPAKTCGPDRPRREAMKGAP